MVCVLGAKVCVDGSEREERARRRGVRGKKLDIIMLSLQRKRKTVGGKEGGRAEGRKEGWGRGGEGGRGVGEEGRGGGGERGRRVGL